MQLLDKIIAWSVRNRAVVVAMVMLFCGFGLWNVFETRFDAFPDLTQTQVQVITASPGMGPGETELLVTLPIERELGGIPGVANVRSLSRAGISSITVTFEEGVDLWHARQLTKERLDAARASIPSSAGEPSIGPPSTGLGEVYQFTISSDKHTRSELDRIFSRDIVPRLLAVEGVVEVNAWGGGAPQLDIEVDPFALASRGLTMNDVEQALRASSASVSGGSLQRGSERTLIRAIANPSTPEALEAVLIRGGEDPVYLRDVARVFQGSALTVGFGTANGEGEVMFAVAQLLAGADALAAVDGIKAQLEEITKALPEGVTIEPIYDRKKLVKNTLDTVTRSLVEGGLLVIFILLLMLGDFRSGLLVASVIPLSMLGAFTGLNLLGHSGNLMSLGAIDFGLIVDGSIVIAESVIALSPTPEAGEEEEDFSSRLIARAASVARPVFFAVSVLILVYIPILAMAGTEGKLFRPMAITVLFALLTALALSFTYIPAVSSWVIKPRGEHKTRLVSFMERCYRPMLVASLSRPILPVISAALLLAGSVYMGLQIGIEFVPQLQEGDLVVQTARLPSISAEKALEETSRIERALLEFQPIKRVASRTGAPGLATDPMGLEESDILIKLEPRDAWVGYETQEELVQAISKRLEQVAPDAELTFTQPIEMRFNEMLEGITSDVGVKISGPDLEQLLVISAQVAETLENVEGAADVTPPTLEGQPGIDVVIDPAHASRRGVDVDALMLLVSGFEKGTEVGTVLRGQYRDPMVLKLSPEARERAEDIPVTTADGAALPLSSLADIQRTNTPAIVEREGGSRRVVVEANVRGRDLGGFVQDARVAVNAIDLPDGYWISWGGKYQQLERAARRTALSVPPVLLLLLLILYGSFRDWRVALLIFSNVPIAASGGIIALGARGLPLSMSAIVGLIALFGIAVMNGFVMLERTRELHQHATSEEAARQSALERLRPVLTTALVAGLGFLPMAMQTGVGAEVQRPLATVVIGGLVSSTALTLIVLPTLYARLIQRYEA